MAEKVTGRSSHPSMNWLTWMYTFLAAGGAPNRVAYRLVMSTEPCTAAGHMPRIRKSRQVSRPWLTGLDPRTMVFAPGSVGGQATHGQSPAPETPPHVAESEVWPFFLKQRDQI